MMSLKDKISEFLDKANDTRKEVIKDTKENVRIITLKKKIKDTIKDGIKSLSVYCERYPTGSVNSIVSELITDLKNRKAAVEKMSGEALQIDSESLMDLIDAHKESTSENESVRKMENAELTRIYRIATSVYQELSSSINDLIEEYKNNS